MIPQKPEVVAREGEAAPSTRALSQVGSRSERAIDIAVALCLAVAAFVASLHGAQSINPVLFTPRSEKAWFWSDTTRVFSNMAGQGSNHYRTKVHPLFSLVAFPLVKVVRLALHLDQLAAARVVIALVASVWISLLYALLRVIGVGRTASVLFSAVAGVSAASMFWFVVPETFSFGSVSILAVLFIVALGERRLLSPVWYTLGSALSLAFATTNWMTGILAAFTAFPRRRALQMTVNAFCIVVVLWGVEKLIFPTAVFFLGDREEGLYVLPPQTGGPVHIVPAFLFHSIVMPAFQEVRRGGHTFMTVQFARLGSGGPWGVIATVIWGVLLALGLWGLFRDRQHPQVRLVLGLTLVGQLALHVIYGEETFLYALHFAPLLVLVAAFSVFTPVRPLAVVLATILVAFAGYNNWVQFTRAASFVARLVTQRFLVEQAIAQRPGDLWPRSRGHVILAPPGSPREAKAYHEPGGSFSPAVGSFGAAVWVTNPRGAPFATSDTIPLDRIHQRFTWNTSPLRLPGIVTETPYYRAEWSARGAGRWFLRLAPHPLGGEQVSLVIRSVGPAGGPVSSLEWDGRRLLVNDRWSVTFADTPLAIHLGAEGPGDWKTARGETRRWTDNSGWGYARFDLGSGRVWTVDVADSAVAPWTKIPETRLGFEVHLPDTHFVDSLEAQLVHIMSGLDASETRPGDPTSYPLEWQRDGAYVVVALARAGKLSDAKALSVNLAEKDFFGGLGPEADAPGLGIWALEEVAIRLHQSSYDRWLWAHVRRKAQIILDMLSATHVVHYPIIGATLPQEADDPERTLVAEPARDGLIIGRMDGHRPVLYVNAVSYRGLSDAAALADRVGERELATTWRSRAHELAAAWAKAFPRQPDNDRTFISGLWPSDVAAAGLAQYRQGLEARWEQRHRPTGAPVETPLWTYFEVAQAHQWLMLGRPDRAWQTLRWFWDHQDSPGLYTWGEGTAKDADPFHLWEGVRGWVDPPHVTPHYWTAAEMLLLQVDMLAYVDLRGAQPVIVIGGGVPPEWLGEPMSVRGLRTAVGDVDWTWRAGEMDVAVRGCPSRVRLGPAFPSDTRLRVQSVIASCGWHNTESPHGTGYVPRQ